MDLITKDTLTVKEFAKTFDIKILHEEFYINKENNHETFNKSYSNMLKFKMYAYYDYSDFDEPKYTSFRNAFISALIERAGEMECIDFSNQFNQYNNIIQKLKYDDMIELWKQYLGVKSNTTKVIENPEQQALINAFKSYETGDLFTDINKINDTILTQGILFILLMSSKKLFWGHSLISCLDLTSGDRTTNRSPYSNPA